MTLKNLRRSIFFRASSQALAQAIDKSLVNLH
jgi:hypothetical protein